MTEPVAYWSIPKTGEEDACLNFSPSKNPNFENIPLYTTEQLQPKIQLTNSEYELLAKVCRGIAPFNKIESNIDIVPDMKWFVRSKESDKDGYYWWLTHTGSNFVPEYMPYKNASSLINSFDTKEQAELWLNPLTEAVQLPVEGE